jgi:hypothetical protein
MGIGGSATVVKRLGCEAYHSPPSSAKVKSEWSHTSIPQYVLTVWCLIMREIRLHGVVLS